jgi:hypothetical protein
MRDARDLPDNISLQVLRALTERFSFDPGLSGRRKNRTAISPS